MRVYFPNYWCLLPNAERLPCLSIDLDGDCWKGRISSMEVPGSSQCSWYRFYNNNEFVIHLLIFHFKSHSLLPFACLPHLILYFIIIKAFNFFENMNTSNLLLFLYFKDTRFWKIGKIGKIARNFPKFSIYQHDISEISVIFSLKSEEISFHLNFGKIATKSSWFIDFLSIINFNYVY